MQYYSPLRYPGGKNKLANFIAKVCEENDITEHYVEPYAGGASVALHLLIEGYVSEITINDIDRSIYAFWYAVLNHTDQFCELVKKTDVNVGNWQKQKDIQKNKENASLLELGFSTFFLNRTNVSGILTGGIIGGKAQDNKYKIGCRFNKENLLKRINKIAEYKDSINLYQLDASELIKKISSDLEDISSVLYLDPPYYVKGKSLYMNYYEYEDHEEISELVKSIDNIEWLVSYDNVEEIQEMYRDFRKKEYSFYHTARNTKKGKEVLFFSNNLLLPKVANPTKI